MIPTGPNEQREAEPHPLKDRDLTCIVGVPTGFYQTIYYTALSSGTQTSTEHVMVSRHVQG